jgi:hypothetical protein
MICIQLKFKKKWFVGSYLKTCIIPVFCVEPQRFEYDVCIRLQV